MYNGKEICQGCGKPGTEKIRYTKTSLCDDCRGDLITGRNTKIESSIVYRNVFQHYHSFHTIGDSVHQLLEALHNPSATALGVYVSLKYSDGNNGKHYKIDERFIEPLAQCFNKLDQESRELDNQRSDLTRLAKNEVQKEKDRIFNEGVEKGRSLLFELNSGGISMSEFEAHLSYKK